ncbi:hypothetical protein CHELA1G11_14128 [Hyphomicrobiales bacterium]|nr:hypothetical protein CHELA1G2_10186 [Hyphomicrobiales bacterium]CAH1676422.1 hypothetical protein CHELA1G11_14128 [Hyphomicrobiales bacterium]
MIEILEPGGASRYDPSRISGGGQDGNGGWSSGKRGEIAGSDDFQELGSPDYVLIPNGSAPGRRGPPSACPWRWRCPCPFPRG